MSGSDALTNSIAEAFERLAAPILFISLLLTAFLASVLIPLPEFTTDLSSFAPDTDADEAQIRAEVALGPSSHLMYVNVKPSVGSNELPNVLEMGALHQLAADLTSYRFLKPEFNTYHNGRRLGVKTGAERRPQPGIQAQRPRTRTARTTRQINGAKSFSG